MRRFKCKNCNKTFKQSLNLSGKKKQISNNVLYLIKEELTLNQTFQSIAKNYDVSVNTVINIFDNMPDQPKEHLSEIICIDEFHFTNNKYGEKYPCVITNPYSGRILDIIRSRRKDYLCEYFSSKNTIERNRVKFYITDMNETYRIIKNIYFKDAVHIIDRFHIAKLFTEAIQTVRIKIMKEENCSSNEYNFLKKNWKLFLMNRNKLSSLKRVNSKNGIVHHYIDDVDEVLKKYLDLNLVYQAKNDFFKKGHNMSYFDAKTHLDFFINQFSNSPSIELNKLGNTLKNWYEEIINAFVSYNGKGNLSNAIAEATNNVIQTYNDMGYGYRNFKRFRKRILYINRQNKRSK